MERKICPPRTGKQLFWLCFIVYTLSCLGRYNYMAVMAELITREGFSKSGAGIIGTAMFVVYGVSQFLTGVLGDRVNPKHMVICGLTGSAIINLVMGCMSSQGAMLVLWMLNGMFQACMWSPVARLFAERLPDEQKKRALSDAAATIPLSMILVYLLASGCIHVASWRFVFWLPGVIMLVCLPVWCFGIKRIEKMTEQEGQPVPQRHKTTEKQDHLWRLILSAGILFAAVGSLSHGLLKDGIQSWLPTFLTETFHIATATSVAASVILPIFNILGVQLTRRLAARYLKNELRGAEICFAAALLALGVLVVFGTGNAALSLAMLTIASTSMIGANILIVNLIPMHFASRGRASSITGILGCSAYAGSAISSFGIGAVVERAGWSAGVWFWLVFAMIAFLAVRFGAKRWQAFMDYMQ